MTNRLLIVQHSADRDGSAVSGLSLANGLLDRGWETCVAFGHPGPMEDVYREAGHHTVMVEHKNWLRRAHPLRFAQDTVTEWHRAKSFGALMSEFGPGVVYINTAVSLPAAVAARRSGIPVVWHLRELFADVGGEMHAPGAAKPLVRWIFRHFAGGLVANSSAVASNLLGPRHAGLAKIVPNAVDRACFDDRTSRAEARRALGFPQDALIVGVPATLRPVKGLEFFLRAVADLRVPGQSLLFAITGDGEPRYAAALREQARKLGLERRTVFTGALDGLNLFYRACDLICVPSRAETFGRVVIEAFGAGAPVVATAVGGIPEIVEHGRDGLLVDYGDQIGLASAINGLLGDAALRTSIGQRARDKALSKYREDLYQERIAQVVHCLAR